MLVDGFLTPTIASAAPSSVSAADVHMLLLSNLGLLALLVLLIELCFVVGYLLFGLETMRAHMFPRWTGLLLLSGHCSLVLKYSFHRLSPVSVQRCLA